MIYGTVVSFFEQKQTQLKIDGNNILYTKCLITPASQPETCHCSSFVTVGAPHEAIQFYLKNDFKYLDKTTTDAETDTCLMYYDLTKLVD